MSKKRYRAFTPKELEIIKENNNKINTKELAVKLGLNYTNVSGMLRFNRINFQPFKTPKNSGRKKKEVEKVTNEFGQKLLTDKLMNSWFY